MISIFKKILKSFVRLIQSRAIAFNFEETKPRIAIFPYISGDAFMTISDVVFLCKMKKPVELRKNVSKKIIFYESGLLEKCKYKLTGNPIVLVHNGDSSLSQKEVSVLKKFNCYVFATNTLRQEGFIEPIPMGIENAHHGVNGSIHYYNILNLSSISLEKKKDVLVSFSVRTNPTERNRVLAICKDYGYQNEKIKISKFRKRLAESRFVISPAGNGVDCHRTWEAFYHKTVPVIESKNNFFEHIDLPILSVNSYQDFFKLSLDERILRYEKIMSRNYPAIYMDYWIERINQIRFKN
jgi:hypothetical protein